jgi:hypothetical protein
VSLGTDSPLITPPLAAAGWHVRSTHAYGSSGRRQPAGLLHAVSNQPTSGGTACGLSTLGLYYCGGIG